MHTLLVHISHHITICGYTICDSTIRLFFLLSWELSMEVQENSLGQDLCFDSSSQVAPIAAVWDRKKQTPFRRYFGLILLHVQRLTSKTLVSGGGYIKHRKTSVTLQHLETSPPAY